MHTFEHLLMLLRLAPRASPGFLVFEFLFGVIWVAYALEQILVVQGHSDPLRLTTWWGLAWLPLIQGAWFAAWGTFFASPLQPSRAATSGGGAIGTAGTAVGTGVARDEATATVVTRARSSLQQLHTRIKRQVRAPCLNAVMLSVPLLHAAVIVTLTIFASVHWRPAVRRWQAFDADLGRLVLQAGPVDTATMTRSAAKRTSATIPADSAMVSPALRQRALDLWHETDEAFALVRRVW